MTNQKKKTVNNRKNRAWLLLSIGFATGFGVAFAFSFLPVFHKNDKTEAVSTKYVYLPSADDSKQETTTTSIKNPVRSVPSPAESVVDSTHQANAASMPAETQTEEADFAMPVDEEPAVLSSHTLLSSRKVKVSTAISNSEEENIKLPPVTQFELQQWSAVIKNKIEYLHTGNVIKVRGLDISQIELQFQDGVYYMVFAHKKYAIPPNKNFEKPAEVNYP